MKDNFIKKFICLAVFLGGPLYSLQVQADCKMKNLGPLNLFVNSETGAAGKFSNGSKLPQTPSLVEHCAASEGPFLMLTTGILSPKVDSNFSDLVFDGKIDVPQCRFENSPFQSSKSPQSTVDLVRRQHRILRSCTYLSIADLEGRPLNLKIRQTACTVTNQPNGYYRLEGDYCFIRLRPINRISISMALKEECQNPEFLKENGINPQDIPFIINAYLTGDDSGYSPDVTAIGTRLGRLYVQPPQSMMPLTEYNGDDNPRFPTEYRADLHMGNISINGLGNTFTFTSSLAVANTGSQICKDGFCSGPNDFMVPVASEMELFRLQNGKKHLVDSWWYADFIHPQWQGLLKTVPHNLQETEIAVGDEYELVTTFVDPSEDFTLATKEFYQFLINIQATLGTAGIDVIPSLGGISGLAGLRPVAGTPNLSAYDVNDVLLQAMQALKMYGDNNQWPAYYENVCNPLQTSCVEAGKQKFYLKLITRFKVSGTASGGDLVLSNFVYKRESPIFDNYSLSFESKPLIRCEAQK